MNSTSTDERNREIALCTACLSGDHAALHTLESLYLNALRARLRVPVGLDPADVIARLRDRLLPPPLGTEGALRGYSGRGQLGAWLRVVATHIALDMQRGLSADARKKASMQPPTYRASPLDDALRLRFQAPIQSALRTAFRVLDARERNLLRAYYLDGVKLEALAIAYGKDPSTVFRWLEAARTRLSRVSHKELKAATSLATTDLDSVIALLESQLEVDAASVLTDI